MDFGLGQPDTTEKMQTGKLPAKFQRADDSDVIKTAVVLALKLGLANAQAVRMLMSVAFVSYLVPTANSIVQAAVKAGRAYNDATKGKSGHGLGHPYPHIWAAMVTAALKTKSDGLDGPKAILLRHSEECKSSALLFKVVAQCRVKRCLEGERHAVMIAAGVDGSEVVQAMMTIIEKEGGLRCWGMAPATGQEREAQKLIDQLTK